MEYSTVNSTINAKSLCAHVLSMYVYKCVCVCLCVKMYILCIYTYVQNEFSSKETTV